MKRLNIKDIQDTFSKKEGHDLSWTYDQKKVELQEHSVVDNLIHLIVDILQN